MNSDYTLNDLFEMGERQETLEGLGINPGQAGFWLLGSCPDGDPIVLDVLEYVGSVCYLCHETMHHKPLRDCCVKVADRIDDFLELYRTADVFPFDYFDAKEQGHA